MRAAILMIAVTVLSIATAGISQSALRVPELARTGDLDGIRIALESGASAGESQGDGMTALHWAAYRDDLALARLLIAAGASADSGNRLQRQTPLHIAATGGSSKMVDVLLAAGATPDLPNGMGTTPLMLAAAAGSVETLQVLLEHGADANAKESIRGQNALMFAASLNREAAVRFLAGKGASLDETSKVEVAKPELVDEDGNPLPETSRKPKGEGAGMGGLTALHYAAREGYLETVRALVESGAGINVANPLDSATPLVIAISNGHFDVAKYLVDQGADPNLATVDGLAPLYATVESQWSPVAWTPNAFTSTSGIVQQRTGYLELLGALLDRGADPNARIKRTLWFSPPHHNAAWVKPAGSTAFWRAAQATDIDAMKLLLSRGANPAIASEENTTALAVATGVGWAGNFSTNAPNSFMAAVRLLVEELGADVNAVDNSGYVPLMGAAYRGDNEMVRYLVEGGARLDVRTKRDWSVTDMANGPYLRSSFPVPHPDTVALLLSFGAPALTPVEDEEILGVIKRQQPPEPADSSK